MAGDAGKRTLDAFLALVRNEGPARDLGRGFHKRNLLGALIPAVLMGTIGFGIRYHMQATGEVRIAV